jgi:glucose/arabinose dehydrogenase
MPRRHSLVLAIALAGRGLRVRDVDQDAKGLPYLLTDHGVVPRIEPAG